MLLGLLFEQISGNVFALNAGIHNSLSILVFTIFEFEN